MDEQIMNNDVAHGFYAKWILPFVLVILGVILIFVFLPSTAFVKGSDGTLYYSIGNNEYVGVEDKYYYELKKNGTTYVKMDKIYDKNIPKYEKWKANLSTIGSASGFSFIGAGGIFLVVNLIKLFIPSRQYEYVDDDEDDE